MNSQRSREGYLLIDHSASPGIPAGYLRAHGIDGPEIGEGTRFEAPTITCSHCKSSFVINPARPRPREYCRKCDHIICDPCAAAMKSPGYCHKQWEQATEEMITAALHRQSEILGSPLALLNKERQHG